MKRGLKQRYLAAVFLSAFVMLISVPQIARAAVEYPRFMELKHAITLAEPWWINALTIVDRDANDARWISEDEDNKVGPDIYIDGHLICSPWWELCWTNLSDKNEGLLWQCAKNDGWWGEGWDDEVPTAFSKTINGVT